MAKGLRSKYKKRLRSAKAAHHYQMYGKAALERLNARLNDPTYQMQNEYSMPANAYLEPDNPLAVFPQVKKPQILDFRCNKIAGGAQAAIGVSRKDLSANTKKSKYATVVITAEQEAAQEEEKRAALTGIEEDMEDAEQPVVVTSERATHEAMAELAAMTEKMTLDKKNKRKTRRGAGSDMMDVDDGDVPKIQIKSKAIKKTKRE